MTDSEIERILDEAQKCVEYIQSKEWNPLLILPSNSDSTTSPLTSLGSVGENYYLCWPIIEHMYQILELFSHSRTRSLASSSSLSHSSPPVGDPAAFTLSFSLSPSPSSFIPQSLTENLTTSNHSFSLVSKVDPVQFNCFFCSIIMILDCHAELVFVQLSEHHWFGILLLARSSLRF